MSLLNFEDETKVAKKVMRDNFEWYCNKYNKQKNDINSFIDFMFYYYNDEFQITEMVKNFDDDDFRNKSYIHILLNKDNFSDDTIEYALLRLCGDDSDC